ncbi:MAG: dus1 [Herbinix sp.]|jgi:tRNA-dihydrouridine synthase|nr:dus1 [Herbinix sp.]
MKYYFAPMEGVTGYIYRNAHNTYFKHIDKYFAPFISANLSDSFKTKELNDILPENNQGFVLIPQILSNHAQDFIHTSKKLKHLGYNEINLNLGCPSGTVVSKNRGSGFLSKREALDAFLDEIFSAAVTKISVKTRIGKDDPDEFYELIQIFNKYPMEELIIHPRIQKDFYKNKPNLKIFKDAMSLSKNKVCYNGDICSTEDYGKITVDFPSVDTVMIGRGLITNPGLINGIMSGSKLDKVTLRSFHDKILYDYSKVLYGDKNVLFKMKEIWFYMISIFSDNEKYAKRIKKSERLLDYEEAVSDLFKEQDILEHH